MTLGPPKWGRRRTQMDKTKDDVTDLLRARHTLLWVVTREEARVEAAIIEAAGKASYETRMWDCAMGLQRPDGSVENADMLAPAGTNPPGILDAIRDRKQRVVYVLRDFHAFLRDPYILRALRSLARSLQRLPKADARSIVILTPVADVPPELAGHATVIDWPLPQRADIAKLLDDVVKALPEGVREGALAEGQREAAIDAAVGLSAEEAANCYSRSLVSTRRVDPAVVAGEKKRVVARGRGVTWEDPDPNGLDAVGGLELIKAWLQQRKAAFSERARAYGLPAPKGAFLVGLPGTGKTLVSRCVAAAWGLPLLSLDLNALQSKYVGESQTNLRQTLALLEAVAPCVVRVDEIEKALAGSQGPAADGGVAADALGTFLTWMQERKAPVFVIATANDVRNLPPELLRKGRFDEVFFVDLPTRQERREVVWAACSKYKLPRESVDAEAVAERTAGYSGAEIAALLPDAMFAAFADGERRVTTEDILAAAKNVVPLSKTASEKIETLRSWAKGRARLASKPEVQTVNGQSGRALDMEEV